MGPSDALEENVEGKGARNVVVIAVWLDGLEVYDAFNIARDLGSQNRLSQHEDEYLLRGGINADDYRILAIFDDNLHLKRVKLSVPGSVFEAHIPGGFAQSLHRFQTTSVGFSEPEDATKNIEEEICSLTGDKGGIELYILLLSIGGQPI